MNSKLLVALLAFSLCVAVASAQMVGLTKEEPADDEVKHIVKSVHAQLEDNTGETYVSVEPISYKTQPVAGTNFFIKALVTTEDRSKSYIHMRVYRRFNGHIKLTAVLTDQHKDTPIKYFQ